MNSLPDFSSCLSWSAQGHCCFQESCYNAFPTVFLLLNVQRTTRSTFLQCVLQKVALNMAHQKQNEFGSLNTTSAQGFPTPWGGKKRNKCILCGILKKKSKKKVVWKKRNKRKPKAENTHEIIHWPKDKFPFYYILMEKLYGWQQKYGVTALSCASLSSVSHQLPSGKRLIPNRSEQSYIFIILHFVSRTQV